MGKHCWSWWWWDHGDQDDNREQDQKMMMLVIKMIMMDRYSYKRDKTTVMSKITPLVSSVRSDLWHSGVPIPSNHPPISSRFVHRILCQELLDRSRSGRHVGDRLQQMPSSKIGSRMSKGQNHHKAFVCLRLQLQHVFLDVSCAVVITSLHYSCLQNHLVRSWPLQSVNDLSFKFVWLVAQSIWTVQANCALE